jgi:DNA adenine methylase
MATPVYEKECDKPYLREFLTSIRSRAGYKPVLSSPLRYAGGKSRAVGLVLEHLPALRQKRIVSPFFGGGSVELALAKHLGFEVIGYDIFGMLTNFWTQLLQHPQRLHDELAKLKATKEDYNKARHILLHYWEQVKPASLVYETRNRLALTDEEQTRLDDDPVRQAAYYYFNMNLSYGPMFLGWASSVYLKPERYATILDRIQHFNVAPGRVSVTQKHVEDAIRDHPDDFLFLDPPYYLGADSKMFKGIYPNSNFAIHHDAFPHAKMAELLKQHRGGFFITYNDCKTIRDLYKDYIQVFPQWHYSFGQGETRVGKNREHGTKDNKKASHEIFIICPPT